MVVVVLVVVDDDATFVQVRRLDIPHAFEVIFAGISPLKLV